MATERIAVLFGGKSVEHEVSIITGHQAMDALEAAGFSVLPIYVTKQGAWHAGRPLYDLKLYKGPSSVLAGGGRLEELKGVYRVSLSPDPSVRQLVPHPRSKRGLFSKDPALWADVFFPAIHGSTGEDGMIQGVFELADVPYVGCDLPSSVFGIDKHRMKVLYRSAGLAVLDCLVAGRAQWDRGKAAFLERVEAAFPYPVMVKPVSLGSSIGVKRCESRGEMESALETALVIDDRALVEPALTDFIEVNCSVLGPPARASICEQPCYQGQLLSFDDKYKAGRNQKGRKQAGAGMASLDRMFPAPIADELAKRIREMSVAAFETIGAAGVARVDFLVDNPTGRVYLNEINTMPGSLSFYLWEKSEPRLAFDELVTRLVQIALERHEEKKKTQRSFEVNLLATAKD
jgi:D-alanine-D-alanine ligase